MEDTRCSSSRISVSPSLAPLAAPESYGLAILLEFRDQSVAVLDHVGILLVLVVWSVRLDDPVDPVDGASDAVASDVLGQIPAG